jgi:hypothetical protein
MAARHITVARDEGAKAGYRFYMAQKAPTARERQAEIRSAGNEKARFAAYCELFRDQLDGVTANPVVQERIETDEQGLFEQFLSWVKSNKSDEIGVQVEADETPAPKIERKRTTRKPRTSAKTALSVGSEFTYHGKVESEWTVVRIAKRKGVDTYFAENARGKESPWKVATVESLIARGKIEVA